MECGQAQHDGDNLEPVKLVTLELPCLRISRDVRW